MLLNINSDPLEATVLEVCRDINKFSRGKAYLVGGSVRDSLFLNTFQDKFITKDYDIEVYNIGLTDLIHLLEKKYTLSLVGKSFGVIKLHDYPIELSLPRIEKKTGTGHKAFQVEFLPTLTEGSIKQACSRRDFTINAILYDPLQSKYIDPFQGQDDIKNLALKMVSPRTFAEDSLRVLRAMQFIARFEVFPDKTLIEEAKKVSLVDLPKERIFEEWKKLLLKGEMISSGIKFLESTNHLKFFPALSDLERCPQDPFWHPEGSVLTHTKMVMDAFTFNRYKTSDEYDNLVIGLACLCHDMGKPYTTAYDLEKKKLTSKGHEKAGEIPATNFLSQLTNSNNLIQEVLPLITNHMAPVMFYQNKDSIKNNAFRKLALRVKRLDRLIKVTQADQEGRMSVKDNSWINWFKQKTKELEISDSTPSPILKGRHIVANFPHIKPGPIFKQLLAYIFFLQIEGDIKTVEEAIEEAKKWIDENI